MSEPKMYGELAAWWPLLSPPEEYAEEAAAYEQALVNASPTPPRSLLELGSGGGSNASYLKHRFEMVLVDRSPGMLEVSRALNPECEHIQADMRMLRLNRQFDGVFVHDAVAYMATEIDLRLAIETAWLHCKAGGVALFAPDHVRETFRPSTDHGGSDTGRRAARFLALTWDPDPSDTSYLVDYAYMLREEDGSVQVEGDRHVEGLFGRADWLRFLSEAGFSATVLPIHHSELEPGSYEVFVCTRPPS